MSEITRGELDDIIREHSAKNPNYRKLLLENPKELVSRQMGQALPENMKVKVVEETADTMYVVAPYVPPASGAELSDSDLEKVAGGKGKGQSGRTESGNRYSCNDTRQGAMATRVDVTTNVGGA